MRRTEPRLLVGNVLVETASGGYLTAQDDGTITTALPRPVDNDPDNMPEPQDIITLVKVRRPPIGPARSRPPRANRRANPRRPSAGVAVAQPLRCDSLIHATRPGLPLGLPGGRRPVARPRCTPGAHARTSRWWGAGTQVSDTRVAFKTAYGRYITAVPDTGEVVARTEAMGVRELWEPMLQPDGVIQFRSADRKCVAVAPRPHRALCRPERPTGAPSTGRP